MERMRFDLLHFLSSLIIERAFQGGTLLCRLFSCQLAGHFFLKGFHEPRT